MDARADVRNRDEWWRSHGTEEFEAAKQIIDVALKASREARDANVFKRGRLLRNAEQVAGEQSARLRMAVPWLEDTTIPSDWDQASRFRMRTTKAIHDHDMKPRTDLVAELEKQLEQAERAGNERPSPEQVKALALRMAERRTEAEKPKPARTDEEGPSTPQGTPRETPRNPEERRRKTKADLFAAIERKVEEKTGEERQRRQKREQTLDDLWEQGQWNRPGHGFSR